MVVMACGISGMFISQIYTCVAEYVSSNPDEDPTFDVAVFLAGAVGAVSFQWKNPDFILKNPDFLLKNVDFMIKQIPLAAALAPDVFR